MKKYFVIPLFLGVLFFGCDNGSDPQETNGLTLVTHKIIAVPEPSDLAMSFEKNFLWTVSDNTGNIYRLSFDGEVLDSLVIEGKDPEGVAVISSQVLAVVFESKDQIVFYDTAGNKLKTGKINFSSEFNLGLEGITYNKNTGHYYIVNEQSPTAILEVDESFNLVDTVELNITQDLSGIFYDERENAYWIVSDESDFLGKFDTSFNILSSYKIDLEQAEGVAVDSANKLIYLVSDKDNGFFVYRIE
jgi:uncharacterized protein YjiK